MVLAIGGGLADGGVLVQPHALFGVARDGGGLRTRKVMVGTVQKRLDVGQIVILFIIYMFSEF